MNRKNQRTRWIEEDLGHCCYAWVCKECDLTWTFNEGGPEENGVKYCPGCGRKIAEYVPYKDPLDEWVEEE